jgi:hypothetical protein
VSIRPPGSIALTFACLFCYFSFVYMTSVCLRYLWIFALCHLPLKAAPRNYISHTTSYPFLIGTANFYPPAIAKCSNLVYPTIQASGLLATRRYLKHVASQSARFLLKLQYNRKGSGKGENMNFQYKTINGKHESSYKKYAKTREKIR